MVQRSAKIRSAFEVTVLLVALVASALIIRELLTRRPGAPIATAKIAVPRVPLSLRGAPLQGASAARVAMIIYSDFQCPYCAAFARESLPVIQKDYVQTGRLQLAFINMPLSAIHPLAIATAEIGVCANDQQRFWEWHDVVFRAQKEFQTGELGPLRARAGLKSDELSACLKGGKASARVDADVLAARELGITSTPTVIIGTKQEDDTVMAATVISGALPLSNFKTAIDAVLAAPATSR